MSVEDIKKQDKVNAQAEGSERFDSNLLRTGRILWSAWSTEKGREYDLGCKLYDCRYDGLKVESSLLHVPSREDMPFA